jgi:hypothetical protein
MEGAGKAVTTERVVVEEKVEEFPDGRRVTTRKSTTEKKKTEQFQFREACVRIQRSFVEEFSRGLLGSLRAKKNHPTRIDTGSLPSPYLGRGMTLKTLRELHQSLTLNDVVLKEMQLGRRLWKWRSSAKGALQALQRGRRMGTETPLGRVLRVVSEAATEMAPVELYNKHAYSDEAQRKVDGIDAGDLPGYFAESARVRRAHALQQVCAEYKGWVLPDWYFDEEVGSAKRLVEEKMRRFLLLWKKWNVMDFDQAWAEGLGKMVLQVILNQRAFSGGELSERDVTFRKLHYVMLKDILNEDVARELIHPLEANMNKNSSQFIVAEVDTPWAKGVRLDPTSSELVRTMCVEGETKRYDAHEGWAYLTPGVLHDLCSGVAIAEEPRAKLSALMNQIPERRIRSMRCFPGFIEGLLTERARPEPLTIGDKEPRTREQ